VGSRCALYGCSARLTAMDERTIKRLLVIVGVSLIVIVLFKTMMTKTIINLNRVAAEKNQSTTVTTGAGQAADSGTTITLETPAASPVGESTAREISATSAVIDTR